MDKGTRLANIIFINHFRKHVSVIRILLSGINPRIPHIDRRNHIGLITFANTKILWFCVRGRVGRFFISVFLVLLFDYFADSESKVYLLFTRFCGCPNARGFRAKLPANPPDGREKWGGGGRIWAGVEWSGKSRLTCTLRLCLGLFPMLMPGGEWPGQAWPQKPKAMPHIHAGHHKSRENW